MVGDIIIFIKNGGSKTLLVFIITSIVWAWCVLMMNVPNVVEQRIIFYFVNI